MAGENTIQTETHADKLLIHVGRILLIVACVLGCAHFLWPEFRWGQGRHSYFNFDNSLTLASWLASVQLAAIAIFSFSAFHKERYKHQAPSGSSWVWIGCGTVALGLSFLELTRLHDRLHFNGLPDPGVYQQMVMYPLAFGLISLFAWFLRCRLVNHSSGSSYVFNWLCTVVLLFAMYALEGLLPTEWDTKISLIRGLAYLVSCTLLLLVVGLYTLTPTPRLEPRPSVTVDYLDVALAENGRRRLWLWIGVGGMTFTIIFLQIILLQLLTIFGDYLTAHSIISIALLGIALGGLIGALLAAKAPLQSIIAASMLLPFCVLMAFGATVSQSDSPLLASILIMLPFSSASTVITVVLARAQSHFVYFIDLLGAALGALAVNQALMKFREEGSLLILCGFTFLLSLCFIIYYPATRTRAMLIGIALFGAVGFTMVGYQNSESEWLNIVRTKVLERYKKAEILFSRSSFVGRYDVIRRKPHHQSVATYNNGRIIDNMRARPAENFQIDPRIPHTLIQDPVILILGLSGDGVSKTSKYLGEQVYGVEINPVVVDLQTNELVEFNARSYEDIEVAIMDGRSYVEQSDREFDMITLMNAHTARGRTAGRAPSPEYLHTKEAMEAYLTHLSDRGVLIVEEPVSRVRREVPVWKMVVTMRQALLERGNADPARHFFIFQWKTKRNNYIQVLMKKTPFTDEEVDNLYRWLEDVDRLPEMEDRSGKQLGPITTKTTILHSPGVSRETNYSRILRGDAAPDFLHARNLYPTTDDKPFHFDVDPSRPNVKVSYSRTLLMTLLLLPFFLMLVRRYGGELKKANPYLLVVGLTGMGYLLVEVILIQRYLIFLGSPVAAFSAVLGTLLFFSGLGSLWSGSLSRRGLYCAIGAIIALLVIQQFWGDVLFTLGINLSLMGKVAATIISIAPLAFFMGVPFPYVLRIGKQVFSPSTAALLFGLNAAASALAVPLTFELAMSYGYDTVFFIGIALYVLVALLIITLIRERFRFIVNGASLLLVSILVLSPLLSNRPVAQAVHDPGNYRVYAVSYGQSSYREDKIMQSGSSRRSLPFEWLFWIIQGNGKTILVDTGFADPRAASKWRIRNYTKPLERLEEFGIHPEAVTDVILTHAHWDHMGNLSPYQNAAIWIQEREYQHATTHLSPHKQNYKGMRWRDLGSLLGAELGGRVQRIDGDHTLAPGISITKGGAHTPGTQYVTIDTLDGPVILAGDATYLYHNNQWHDPIGTTVDAEANLAAIRAMHAKAASPFFIVPGHDPEVIDKFPEVSPSIVQITAVAEPD